jgi:hypothetical protein
MSDEQWGLLSTDTQKTAAGPLSKAITDYMDKIIRPVPGGKILTTSEIYLTYAKIVSENAERANTSERNMLYTNLTTSWKGLLPRPPSFESVDGVSVFTSS